MYMCQVDVYCMVCVWLFTVFAHAYVSCIMRTVSEHVSDLPYAACPIVARTDHVANRKAWIGYRLDHRESSVSNLFYDYIVVDRNAW